VCGILCAVNDAPSPDRWWTLGAVCLGMFMLLLDITVVNVALPDIQKDLGSSFSDLQWVVDAYSLSLASLLLTAGALADLLGRKRVFAFGLVVFVLASVGCGLSGSPLVLNIMRAAQGVGGSVMFATSLALVAAAFSGKERGTAFGLYGATIGAAVAVGPLVGGALTEGAGWQWIFFVNVPVGIIALAVTLLRVKESKDPDATGVDWAGLVTFSGGLFAIVFALVRGNALGWGSTTIVTLFVVGAVLLVAFYVVERRQPRPMFDLSLLSKPAFAGASIVGFTIGASMFAMFLYLTLYIQGVLGYSPLEAGLRFLPITLLSFFVAPVAGRLSVRVPVRALLGLGMLAIAVGLFLMRSVSFGDDWTALLPGMLLGGIGIGLVNAPLVSTAVAVVPPARSGMASGINNTFRQVGVATGIAALGAIFEDRITSKAVELVGARGEKLGPAFSSGAGDRIKLPGIHRVFELSFLSGLHAILVVSAIVALVGAIAGVALVRPQDFDQAAGRD
jgi:EmrB/QacA subfamily drug resistance transporter